MGLNSMINRQFRRKKKKNPSNLHSHLYLLFLRSLTHQKSIVWPLKIQENDPCEEEEYCLKEECPVVLFFAGSIFEGNLKFLRWAGCLTRPSCRGSRCWAWQRSGRPPARGATRGRCRGKIFFFFFLRKKEPIFEKGTRRRNNRTIITLF